MSDNSINTSSSQFKKIGGQYYSTATGELLEITQAEGNAVATHDGAARGGWSGVAPEDENAGPGLSKAHSSTKAKAEYWLNGSLITVAKPKIEQPQVGGGKRGKVKEFSKAARRRMLYMMAKTDKTKKPIMITLTYPLNFPGSPGEWKRHLKLFLKRLVYTYPAAAGVWKLEPQKRGAPHYHILCWMPVFMMAELRLWVSKVWFEVVNSGDPLHLLAGTRVELVKSERGVMAYAGKYVGKVTDDLNLSEEVRGSWGQAGKWWGIFQRDNIPWAVLVTCELTYSEACKVMRLMRRAGKLRSRDYKSLNLLCGADFWFDRLDRMLV